MRDIIWLLVLLILLGGCAANRELTLQEELGYEIQKEEPYIPEEIDPHDWSRFYIAVFNEEYDVIEEFLAKGFDIGTHQEDISTSLYYEIYHSIQGFESRYLDGPLDSKTQAYYSELEQNLIQLCKRLWDLGLKPDNREDLIAAATFREFPNLIEWLETEF